MNYTREQNIYIIEGYMPGKDMRSIEELVKEACPEEYGKYEIIWRDLPDRAIEELAYLCVKESNEFYRKHA